jgi:hypothetical protein
MESIKRSAIALSLGLMTALPLAAAADEAQSPGAMEVGGAGIPRSGSQGTRQ